MERLYLKDIQDELHYKDRRSVRRWCRNNGVLILSDIGSNKQYVLKEEFEKAKNKNYFNCFKKISSSQHTFSPNDKICGENMRTYIPQGIHEINFLNCLQNY